MQEVDRLAAFAADERLRVLEGMRQRPRAFNLVSAFGLGRHELRHSRLLAYLLDSRRSHGLGSALARALLQVVAPRLAEPLDVDTLRLDDLRVQREWSNIDILIESPADRLAVIIENKVDSDEHSDQLARYYQILRTARPDWRIVGVFLTLRGTPPAGEADQERYAPLGYSDLAAALTNLNPGPHADSDAVTLLRHYARFIRSTLVPEPDHEQAALARRLYMDHRGAIDAMHQARDARMGVIDRFIGELLTTTMKDQPGLLTIDKAYRNDERPRWHTRFAPPEWYRPELQVSNNWNRTGLVLIFDLMHAPNEIHLALTVGPARRHEKLRRQLYELAQQRVGKLSPAWSDPENTWFNIYTRFLIRPEADYFASYSDEAIFTAIREGWEAFLADDLPVIRETINAFSPA